jgi:hypothetical protein
MECKENRKFDLHDIPDKLPEEAWAILKKASDEKDLEDFREVRTAESFHHDWLTNYRLRDSKSIPRPRLLPPSTRLKRSSARRTSRSTSLPS